MEIHELKEALQNFFSTRGGGRVWDQPAPGAPAANVFGPRAPPTPAVRWNPGTEERLEIQEETSIANNLSISAMGRLRATDQFKVEVWSDADNPLRYHCGRILECDPVHHRAGTRALFEWRSQIGRKVTVSKGEAGRGFAAKLFGGAEDRVIVRNGCWWLELDRPLYKCAEASNLVAYFT